MRNLRCYLPYRTVQFGNLQGSKPVRVWAITPHTQQPTPSPKTSIVLRDLSELPAYTRDHIAGSGCPLFPRSCLERQGSLCPRGRRRAVRGARRCPGGGGGYARAGLGKRRRPRARRRRRRRRQPRAPRPAGGSLGGTPAELYRAGRAGPELPGAQGGPCMTVMPVWSEPLRLGDAATW